jgi:monothiol glutaredoxin
MKGNKDFPQCGFSAAVVQILNRVGVDFIAIDVLSDSEIRQGIKEFSDWPTIPQLYVKGEFIGGCDIVREMYENGSLSELVRNLEGHGAARHNQKHLTNTEDNMQLSD